MGLPTPHPLGRPGAPSSTPTDRSQSYTAGRNTESSTPAPIVRPRPGASGPPPTGAHLALGPQHGVTLLGPRQHTSLRATQHLPSPPRVCAFSPPSTVCRLHEHERVDHAGVPSAPTLCSDSASSLSKEETGVQPQTEMPSSAPSFRSNLPREQLHGSRPCRSSLALTGLRRPPPVGVGAPAVPDCKCDFPVFLVWDLGFASLCDVFWTLRLSLKYAFVPM